MPTIPAASFCLKYEEYGENFVNMLDGVFSFVLYDTRNKTYMAARDAVGVNPLYFGRGSDGTHVNPASFCHHRFITSGLRLICLVCSRRLRLDCV